MPQERSNKHFPFALVAKMSWSKAKLSPLFHRAFRISFCAIWPNAPTWLPFPTHTPWQQPVGHIFPANLCPVCKQSEPCPLVLQQRTQQQILPDASPGEEICFSGLLLLNCQVEIQPEHIARLQRTLWALAWTSWSDLLNPESQLQMWWVSRMLKSCLRMTYWFQWHLHLWGFLLWSHYDFTQAW